MYNIFRQFVFENFEITVFNLLFIILRKKNWSWVKIDYILVILIILSF